MTAVADLLVEIGTEELPPKALKTLMLAFGERLEAAIDDARLAHGPVLAHASPRRLAVVVERLAAGQEDRRVRHKGPPASVAFGEDGALTPAGRAFAKKRGVDPATLERITTEKGEWVYCELVEAGRAAVDLLPGLVDTALAALPIPRRMRWGAGDAEFVRPVHWVVLLYGKKSIAANILGIRASNESHGHRVHSDGPLAIASPAEYLDTLESPGFVIADFERRRNRVRDGVLAAAKAAGGSVVNGDALYDEVTALVEWPVPLTGTFDEEYLQLPHEVVVSTLTGHQRYFPIAGADGHLLPRFVTIANLESKDPDQVRDGNERVVRPRLADAAFFWESDRQRSLDDRREALRDVVYQRGLGSLFDKAARTAALAADVAAAAGADPATVARAAGLSKSDLVTGMVGEFPELQGIMGRYYAEADGEAADVAAAIGEHYRPRFAGDDLPATPAGRALAVADKLDTLAGIFSLGRKPTGNRDPFGLRRAALGVVRILIETALDVDLTAAVGRAISLQPIAGNGAEELQDELYGFIAERLRGYCLDRDAALTTETFDAVLARRPASLVDFDRRLTAVQGFLDLEPAASLAAANKRIANILRQAGEPALAAANETLLREDAESALYAALVRARTEVEPLVGRREYTAALTRLASLREPVDRFFDDVMVMADDDAIRDNRLALLAELRSLFLGVADVSRLAI